jgi:hypothetical protein
VLVDGLVCGAREPRPVDDRGVVERVGEDRGRAVAERVEQGGVGVPARGVGQRRLGAEEAREVALQLHLGSELAAYEAHRRGSGAVFGQRLDAGVDDSRVVGEAEVVVGAQAEDLAAPFDLHQRPLGRVEHRDRLQRPRGLHPLQLVPELCLETAHALPPRTVAIDSSTIA